MMKLKKKAIQFVYFYMKNPPVSRDKETKQNEKK